jgi:membrane-bound inhibitor of C-type lysozyme
MRFSNTYVSGEINVQGGHQKSFDPVCFIFHLECVSIIKEMGKAALIKRNHFLCSLFFSGLLILAPACTSQPPEEAEVIDAESLQPGADAQTFVYECGEEYSFVARIQGEKAWLFLPGRTVPLPQVPSGAGSKFSNGQITFWSRGEEALVFIGEQEQYSCRNNRIRAVWEHAKLNGVSFRAVGNEPGWHLEIYTGERIVLVTDYGESRLEFAAPDPVSDQGARTTTYRVQDEEHDLTILIEGRPCQDTMSGEEFSAAVTVTLDGKTLSGCGRALH